MMFVGGPNSRKDYHIEEGEEVSFIEVNFEHYVQCIACMCERTAAVFTGQLIFIVSVSKS